jgi:nicotinate phosphoribosyltransferase
MLDNDQYKFTMQQALLKLGFASVPVEYKFKCRSEGVDFTRAFETIKHNIMSLEDLQFTATEIDYLRSLRYFSEEYIGFLKYFRFNTDYINLSLNDETGELYLRIRGPWFHTILFEVPKLAVISESHGFGNGGNQSDAEDRLEKKLTGTPLPEGFRFADFGTRRRKSYSWHYRVVEYCKKTVPENFVGTSNLFLAMQLNLKPIGTMAHEWVQAHQQLNYRLADSQIMAFENWIKVYRGDLGIALSDTINTDSFLKDFNDPLLYKLFDGVREDSEPDPIQFGHRIVNFYLSKNIDPKTKTIVFSNSLDFDKAINIHNHLHNLIGLSFGIGTNLTNDWSTPALNMVIKMVRCNDQPVAKVSNSPGKGICEDDKFVSYLKSVYN